MANPKVTDHLLPPTVAQTMQAFGECQLGMCWSTGDRIAVFPRHATAKKSSTVAKRPIPLVEVKGETVLQQPIFVELLRQSSEIFFSTQKAAQDGQTDGISQAQLLELSRKYRSVMRECQGNFDSLLDNEHGDARNEAATKLRQSSELVYKLELIWNLVEILFIEKQTAGIVLPRLLQWISEHFPQCDEQVRSVLQDYPENPEVHPLYWDTLTLFLLQGRREQFRSLLRLHSDFGDDVESRNGISDGFESLDELVRKMPTFAPQMSIVDFGFRWKHWQSEVKGRIEEGDFASNLRLQQLALLISGNDDAFSEITSSCETWYQWMIGKLLFTNPDVKIYDLTFHAEKAIHKYGGIQGMTSLDSIIFAALEMDLTEMMNELCTCLDNFWFPAHLSDMLFHTGQMNTLDYPPDLSEVGQHEQYKPGPGLREFFLLDYASFLMDQKALWEIGVRYLDHCPKGGIYRLELLLERIRIDDEETANKVLEVAADRSLRRVYVSICKVLGIRAYRNGNIKKAMKWALQSQDSQLTTFLADALLEEYCEKGDFTSSDLLDNLGSCMVVSDRLTFLVKYREFHKLCQESNFESAAKLLHSLLWSRLAPKYFWVTLLIDAVPFLNASNQVYLSSMQTYEILHCLQELVKDESLPKKQRLLLEEHEPQIRLNLAQNLALALMEEGDSGGF